MTLKFSDGIEINTDGELRIIKEIDGFYVAGKGLLISVTNRTEGNKVINEMKNTKVE